VEKIAQNKKEEIENLKKTHRPKFFNSNCAKSWEKKLQELKSQSNISINNNNTMNNIICNIVINISINNNNTTNNITNNIVINVVFQAKNSTDKRMLLIFKKILFLRHYIL
jgi:hypothetical protein